MAGAWQSSAHVDVTEENGTLVLRLVGELDMASRETVEPVVMAALTSATSVCLDLADLSFCDSSGLAMLIAANQKIEAEGATLTVRNLRPSVRRVFAIAGLDDVIAGAPDHNA